MSRKEALLVSQHPFPDPDDYQRYLRGFEDEGHIITAIGEVFDLSKPEDRANWYEFDLPANLQQPASALQVKVVPDAATADQNEYKAFLSPFLDAFELVDRAKVFIGGKDMEVVLLRPMPEPPSVTDMSWDTVLTRKAWSAQLITSVTESIPQLEQGNPDAFLNGYSALSSALRIKFWAELLIAVAKFESSWKAREIFHENFGVDSVGLLQLSYEDQTQYKLEPLDRAAKSLEDPLINLRCGVTIFTKLVLGDKIVASSVGGTHRGAAKYWSTLRAGHILDQIISLTKKNVGL
jgi:hypothetical protein